MPKSSVALGNAECETEPKLVDRAPPTASNNEVRRSVAVVATTRGSFGGAAKVRESFAAALWNPMHNQKDKDAFNRRRFWQLVTGILMATCGGSAFAFGVFSNKIKESAHFSQTDMTTITTAGNIAAGFTFPAGILFDYFGPQSVLGAATFLSCGGFALLAMIFQGVVPATVVSVGAANALTNIGVGFTDSGSLMTNLFNFPINRGDVLIIQKTFFGLGSTFLSLSFDGFFGPTNNYIGYAVYVCILTGIACGAGTIVTRLPPYKPTTRELNRIAKIEDPVQKERERQNEERSFEMFHNPRLIDRRRLNVGVTCLFVTLIFFSTFSIVKTYVSIPSNVITGLTVCACLCLASFLVLVAPIRLPKFFDYEFLPDLHPPEALVDKPEDDDDDANNAAKNGSPSVLGDNESIASTARGREYENERLIGSNAINNDNGALNYSRQSGGGAADEFDGRASAFLPNRASVAGNSAPIAIPQAIAPSAIPSVTTPFTTSILRPLIWCFFVTAFAMTGSSNVIVANISQILTAANKGVYDQKINSLALALFGIGSACGRISIGFAETYFQRQNALLREKQLVWEALHGPEDESLEGGNGSGSNKAGAAATHPDKPDMTPVYHRFTSTVVCLLPLTPLLLGMSLAACTFLPVNAIPVAICLFGAGYGAFLALLALGIREMFSVDVAKHYNFITASGIASSVLLNRLMFGGWFDAQTKEHPAADGVSCDGYSCFADSLFVLAGLCGAAILSTVYIVHRWWQVRKTF